MNTQKIRTTRFGTLVVCLSLCTLCASQENPDQPVRTTTEETVKQPDYRTAVEANVQAYAEAFNKKEADKLSSLWTEKGVYVSQPSGQEILGREALKDQLLELFKSDEKRSIALKTESLQLISPSVVLQRATSVVTTGEGEKIQSSYRAIFVLQDGKWLIDRVTEDESERPAPSNYDHLKALDWMLGEWVDQSEEQTVQIEANFTTNRNFITRAYAVYVNGDVEASGMEVIGWDSKKKQIRSWLFDSQGGFIESQWTQKKDRWIVQSVATLPGGKSGSYTSVYRPLAENSYGWQKVNQQMDGQLLPNLDEVIISRKSN